MPTYRGRGPFGAGADDVRVGPGEAAPGEPGVSGDAGPDDADDGVEDVEQPTSPAPAPATAPTNRRLLQPPFALLIPAHPG
ncbi:hypothetical protein M2164_001162 [Streptomyces sp. SAI-208]|uniref:hypothetical protein n=1 Tax=unclassified Streptomyces TaxID=2593676 RepID=UPI0024732948|nr:MULTISPECIES: hypothetical protein [unclassified Streptomyces]MDH6514680.1 hypothetical protein [Streptomyces sp. SAI-090]MDH6546859.1 hypothetical protein [Streptomyces sp. SAI-041]MDH6565972.1 hypothetical protein [Streptomyces sp. SAI-117]MDH6605527.1 hypothetical protein [Streptomyces sp. SAI-208]